MRGEKALERETERSSGVRKDDGRGEGRESARKLDVSRRSKDRCETAAIG
jgi:hypothetical protein